MGRAIRHPRSGPGHLRSARPELASRLLVFEIDQPGPQAWKRQRLVELGLGIPSFLRLVPVDLEQATRGGAAAASGFDIGQPAVVASPCQHVPDQGRDRSDAARVASLAPGSTLAMSFMLPIELTDPRCVWD